MSAFRAALVRAELLDKMEGTVAVWRMGRKKKMFRRMKNACIFARALGFDRENPVCGKRRRKGIFEVKIKERLLCLYMTAYAKT